MKPRAQVVSCAVTQVQCTRCSRSTGDGRINRI